MASKKAAKGVDAARSVASNPYLQRILEDAELRENIRSAFEASRKAYGRMSNGKAPSKMLDDRKLQKELREAATSLREVGVALKEGPKKKKKRRLGRLLLLGIVGGALALALSEGLRKKVLDALFGAEEEFDYTSTTTPSPAPDTVAA